MRRSESGQAMVEAALTMPMAIFLILGTIQLFMMLQARLMAEYAVVQAVRQGSVQHGACEPMVHTAVTMLLPTFRRTNDVDSLEEAFKGVYREGASNPGAEFRFQQAPDMGHDREVAWLYRRAPLAEDIRANEENAFDDPTSPPPGGRHIMELELVYWFPLKIPFANWIIARMALAENNIRSFTGANPLMLTQKNANWNDGGGTHAVDDGELRTEWGIRVDADQYTVPIIVNAAMPMMSPPRARHFGRQNCFVPPAS